MRSYLLFIPFLLGLSNAILAQKISEKGAFEAGVGTGVGIYSVEAVTDNSDTLKHPTGQVEAVLLPIKLGYSFLERFNGEITFQPIDHYERLSTAGPIDIKGFALGFGLSYHFVNEEDFAVYGRASGGFSLMDFYLLDLNGEVEIDYRGKYFDLGGGVKYLFTPRIGLFLDLNYSIYDHSIHRFSVGGVRQDPDEQNVNLGLKGAELSTGLSVSF